MQPMQHVRRQKADLHQSEDETPARYLLANILHIANFGVPKHTLEVHASRRQALLELTRRKDLRNPGAGYSSAYAFCGRREVEIHRRAAFQHDRHIGDCGGIGSGQQQPDIGGFAV